MIDPRNAFPYNDNIVESTVFLFEYLINDTRESAFCTETGIVSLWISFKLIDRIHSIKECSI